MFDTLLVLNEKRPLIQTEAGCHTRRTTEENKIEKDSSMDMSEGGPWETRKLQTGEGEDTGNR